MANHSLKPDCLLGVVALHYQKGATTPTNHLRSSTIHTQLPVLTSHHPHT